MQQKVSNCDYPLEANLLTFIQTIQLSLNLRYSQAQ